VALYFAAGFNGTVPLSDTLLREFMVAVPALFKAVSAGEPVDAVAIFCVLFQKYYDIVEEWVPLEQAVLSLNSPAVPYANATVLRYFVLDVIEAKPRGTFTGSQIREVLGQLVLVSVRLLSFDQDEATTTDEHFVAPLRHLEPGDGKAVVADIAKALLDSGDVAAVCTAVALVDASIGCYGLWDFADGFLRFAMGNAHPAIKRGALSAIFSGRSDCLGVFIESNYSALAGELCA